MNDKKTVLSCIQPTGDMHYGNYFGAVKNWVELQSKYECFYGVVDYHAITMPYSPQKLRESTWDLIINLMATGIEPKNLFIQSLIPEHVELCWIFNCFASFGQVGRMTQFKDKSAQSEEKSEGFISVGLFDYPVLQAADILIYRADYVPVGKDQEQHLELSRNIAQRFNNQIGKEYFVLPESLYTETPNIRSTADPIKKMSKSAGEKHYINVFAEETAIRKQIKSAVTGSNYIPGEEMSPGVANLFELLSASGSLYNAPKAAQEYSSLKKTFLEGKLQYADLKEAVSDSLVEISERFRQRKAELNNDKKAVKEMVKSSSETIRKRAQQTIREVKELAGLLNVRV